MFDFFRRAKSPLEAAAVVKHVPHRDPPSEFSGSAAELARQIVREIVPQLNSLERVDLDFTPLSLHVVDQILDRCSARGMRSANQKGLTIGLVCYFGEIVCRHAGGQWIFHRDSSMAEVKRYPPGYLHLMIVTPDGDQFINVHKKICARLDGDRSLSLAVYYKFVTTLDSRSGKSSPSNQA